MNYLIRLWDLITENGINEEKLGKSAVKFRLANQLIFLSLLTSVLALLSYIITNEDIKFVWTTMGNVSLEIAIIILIRYGKYDLAMFLASWVFASLVAFNVIVLGGNFGEVNIFTALSLTSFIFYDENKIKQFSVVFYICFLFVGSKLYVIQHFIEQIGKESPYDEIITFPMIVIILGLIILLYQKELKKHEERQMVLIKDLEQKNKTLLSVNKELEEFTYIASHDLKTPLHTLSTHVGLARRNLDRKNYEELKMDFNFIEQGAKQMYVLVRDILEYKTIHNPSDALETVDLNMICEKVIQEKSNFLKTSNGQVIYKKLPAIKIRFNEIWMLFQQLIQNGILYNTSETPTVWIDFEIKEDKLLLTFKDNGIGIATEYHTQIFKFFKRLHTRKIYEGTGIGLGLCKKIVRNYEGTITVDSCIDNGSIFVVTLPQSMIVK